MSTIVIYVLSLTALFVAIIILLAMVINQHEDDTIYLESFLDQCLDTPENKALAERELDMLRYKVTNDRFLELWNKFNDKFNK